MLLCRMRFTEMHVTEYCMVCGSQSTLVFVDCKTLVALIPLKGCLPWRQITPLIILILSTWRWNFRRIWNSMTVTGSVSSATGLLTKESFLLFSYSFQIPYCLLAEKRNLSFQCPHMHLHVTGTTRVFVSSKKALQGPSKWSSNEAIYLPFAYFCRYFCYLLFWLGNSLNQAPFAMEGPQSKTKANYSE